VADGVAITPGTGITIATDDVGGTHYQKVKAVFGASDTATDITASTPLPVDVIAAVKAASTAPVAADKAMVVSVSPNSPGVIDAANSVSGVTAALTTTTAAAVLPAPGASLRNYISNIVVSNSHATVGTDVEIRDGTTVIYVIPAAAVYGGAAMSFPVPLRQPTANAAINAACSVTGASVRVSASGYKGA
jgi:hypothetical protein